MLFVFDREVVEYREVKLCVLVVELVSSILYFSIGYMVFGLVCNWFLLGFFFGVCFFRRVFLEVEFYIGILF